MNRGPDAGGDAAPGYQPQSWEQRYEVAAQVFVPWLETVMPLAGKTVLEYGSGTGSVSCALAERAGRLIGLDIEGWAIDEAERQARERGLSNLELEVHAPAEILERFRSLRGEIDLVCFYAVLEHLTIEERLEALRLAREVVRPEGLIAVIELPNRLVDTDYHTSMLPFFDQLPTELAVAYADRSPRAEFREPLLTAREQDADGGSLALARWGRGASYHEFELVFGDLGAHVVGGGWDPRLLGERTVHADEVQLARYLQRARPDVPPPFSRYWIDLLLSPEPVDPESVRLIWPWTMETRLSRRARSTNWESIHLPRLRRLTVQTRGETERAVCVLVPKRGRARVTLRSEGQRVQAEVAGEVGHALVCELALLRPVREFTLEASTASDLMFVGCELPGLSSASAAHAGG